MDSVQRYAVAKQAVSRDVKEAILRATKQAKSITGEMFGSIDPAQRLSFAEQHLAKLCAEFNGIVKQYCESMHRISMNDSFLIGECLRQNRGCVYLPTIDVDLIPRDIILFEMMINKARIIKLTKQWIAQTRANEAM